MIFFTRLHKKHTPLFLLPLFLSSFFSGCMTSSRQDQLQASIDQLNAQVQKMQGQVSSKEQQINNTTQTAIASQNEAQSVQDQLQLTQGAVDELRNRLKRIEENSASASAAPSVLTISSNMAELLGPLQKKVARLELQANNYSLASRTGKLNSKIKNATALNKLLKSVFDKGDFAKVILLTTKVMNAANAPVDMVSLALEYRGEARFQTQDYKNAAIDFSTFVEVFPTSPRKARALLLAGDSYIYLKNNDVAKLYYQDCSSAFPGTDEGKASSSRLANLSAQMNKTTP